MMESLMNKFTTLGLVLLTASVLSACDLEQELLGGVVVPAASFAARDQALPTRLAALATPRMLGRSPRSVLTTAGDGEIIDIRNRNLANPIAYITSQCFTKTEADDGTVHNPCFACHIPSTSPNYLDDGDVQLGYDFPGDEGAIRDNPWTNLFKDRTNDVAAIGDADILAYVRQDNYAGSDGYPSLTRTLRDALPVQWDVNGNGRWDGYVPDAGFTFDEQGFDHLAGGYTGWRAFAYAPFLGTFWPTNGSTDDVLIRLAPAFWQTEQSVPDLTVYKTNLAIVTAMIQRRDVPLDAPVDETVFKVDLDKDGRLAMASTIRYDWAPLQSRYMYYVGKARLEQTAGRVHLAAGLFPEGTEFLHSVRYLDVDETNGSVGMAKRFKELRYAVKKSWYTYSDLKEMGLKEQREKVTNPERTRQLTGNAEIGMSNGQGWTYQGFIEDRQGKLRPQTYEETVFCIGCHSGTGATTDGAFSFPRKFAESAHRQGWYHWSQKSLAGTPEPLRRDGQPEYAHYLAQNGAGDEFRENREVMIRFFDASGRLLADILAKLREDVTVLLVPSAERALALNKAYRVIVGEQSFAFGRDATIAPAQNVHRSIVLGTPTGIRTVVEGP
jgi:hypothetical protein